jgi:hypothetical protein
MEELPRQIPDVVRLEVQRLQGSLEVKDFGGNIGEREVRQILTKISWSTLILQS